VYACRAWLVLSWVLDKSGAVSMMKGSSWEMGLDVVVCTVVVGILGMSCLTGGGYVCFTPTVGWIWLLTGLATFLAFTFVTDFLLFWAARMPSRNNTSAARKAVIDRLVLTGSASLTDSLSSLTQASPSGLVEDMGAEVAKLIMITSSTSILIVAVQT